MEFSTPTEAQQAFKIVSKDQEYPFMQPYHEGIRVGMQVVLMRLAARLDPSRGPFEYDAVMDSINKSLGV